MTNISKQQLGNLPAQPGVYLFKNDSGSVLYVGKAKNLRARVRSYFKTPSSKPLPTTTYKLQASTDLDPAKQQMVREIAGFETIVVDSENEALILEANLIRQHQPPYNVVLTDDKYYLFIKITNEPLPRVFPTRKLKRDNARYFGPFSSARSARRTLKLLKRLFPHLDDKNPDNEWVFPHPLFADTAKSAPRHAHAKPLAKEGSRSKVKPKTLDQQQYQQNIQSIIRFLQGDREEIIKTLHAGMKQAARQQNFERAAIFRDQLNALERLEGNQKVHLPRRESFDVISIATDQSRSAANVFQVRHGKLLNKSTFLLKSRYGTDPRDILRQFILQYYRDAQDIPRTICLPLDLPDHSAISKWINQVAPPKLVVPQRGKKRQLINMGELNAQQLLNEELADFQQDERLRRAAQSLAHALNINHPLKRIETYDISNIQGTHATGSMVVFTDGKPDKNQYRKFRIRAGDTPNDYAMLQEVLSRRFASKHEEWSKPDLVLIDGGKGQLSAAQTTLTKLGLTDISLAAIAKREEELFTCPPELQQTGTPLQFKSIRLPYDDDALYLVQRMRDEAHRFTLTYHQLLRSKKHSRSLLDEIPGIGPKTKKKLLTRFGSLKAIRAASESDLKKVIGQKAKLLKEYL